MYSPRHSSTTSMSEANCGLDAIVLSMLSVSGAINCREITLSE